MPQTAREVLARMSEDELAELILRLGRYALGESNRLRWRTSDSVELPGGETIDSIVSLALEKTLSGERRWNSETQPKLQEYLMDVIDSLLSHLATGRDNSLFTKTTSPDGLVSDVDKPVPHNVGQDVEWLTRGGVSPETLLLQQEEAELHERALELLCEECEGDPVLLRIIEVMMEGNEKAEQIAMAAGLNIKEVYNAMKRLSRKALRVSLRISDVTVVTSPDN
jgi:hypothetical protein